jgi:hypothetical protein
MRLQRWNILTEKGWKVLVKFFVIAIFLHIFAIFAAIRNFNVFYETIQPRRYPWSSHDLCWTCSTVNADKGVRKYR